LYLGVNKLHTGQLIETEFQDTSYAGQSTATYGVVAVDSSDQRSPMRKVTVYPLELNALANTDDEGNQQTLLANHFSRFEISVDNLSTESAITINELNFEMTVNAEVRHDETLTLDQSIPVEGKYTENMIVPIGNTDEDHLVLITAIQTDASDNRVYYQRPVLFEYVAYPEDMISISLDDVPLAGGFTTAQMCLNNPGYTPLEIIAAREEGQAPGDLYVSILDDQGLEIARGEYQGIPSGAMLRGTDIVVTLEPSAQVCVDIQVLVPAGLDAGAQLSFVGSVSEVQNSQGNQLLTTGGGSLINGNTVSGITQSTYYGIASADQSVYGNDDTVTITGQAISRLTGLPEINAPIKLGFETRGYKWFEELTTDSEGDFSFEYIPTIGLSGEFQIWAAHPDVYDTLNQDSFSFYRLYANPSRADIRSSKADTLDFEINLVNPGEEALDTLNLSFRAYTLDNDGNEIEETSLQGELNTANDWSVLPGESEAVQLQLIAGADSPTNVNVEYTLSTGIGASATFEGTVNLSEAIPLLDIVSPTVGYVDTSLNVGATKTVPITITNQGLRDLEDAVLTLPQTITWISTPIAEQGNSQVTLGTIPVGESVTFDVLFTPPEDANYGYHEDSFTISGSNAVQDFNVNVYALITSSETGSVQFNVFNILGLEVPNARVRLWNNTLEQEIEDVFTDENGLLVVNDLKLGDWSWQVGASGHDSTAGTVRLEADQIVVEFIELNKSLVTVNFNVVPVPYTDEYQIIVEQQFDTHVPMPVLVISPEFKRYENVESGFEDVFLVKVSNEGLKGLDDVILKGDINEGFSLDPLVAYLPRLNANSSVMVPYRFKYQDQSSPFLPNSFTGGLQEFNKNLRDCRRRQEALLSQSLSTGNVYRGMQNIIRNMKQMQSLVEGQTKSLYSDRRIKLVSAMFAAMLTFKTISDTPSIPTSPKDIVSMIAKEVGKSLACILPPNKKCEGECPKYFEEEEDEEQEVSSRKINWSVGVGAPGCFVPGTPIKLADGSLKRIEDVIMGDQVLGFNGEGAGVTHVYTRETDHLRELRYRNLKSDQLHRVETTDEHLYWVQNRSEWIRAGALEVGDTLALADSQFAIVEATSRREIGTVVYNFDVEGLQSYYANGALVYQQCGAETDPSVTQQLLSTQDTLWQQLKRPARPAFLDHALREGF